MPTAAEHITVELPLLQSLREASYGPLRPDGLITPLFPDTFAASAFHTRIVDLMAQQTAGGRSAGVEWVFRHVDGEKVGYSPAHLSLFRMLVYFDASAHGRTQRESAIAQFLRLTTLLGLRRERIAVTYFGGGDICGRTLPPDAEFADAWRNAGIRRDYIVPVPGQANFTNIRRSGEPAGPRCEVYYELPNHPSPVEIGTVVCEQYILDAEGHAVPTQVSVCGGAVGIERLEMCARDLRTIADVEAIDHLVLLMLADASPQARSLFRVAAIRIANGLRALTTVACYTRSEVTNGRGSRVRAIARDILRAARESAIPLTEDLVRRLVGAIELHEAATAPHASERASTVLAWLERAASRATNARTT